MNILKRQNNYGQLLIEILIVIGISSILFPALLTGLVTARSGKAQQNQRIEAVGLLKEAEEAVRSAREKDWAEVGTNGTFHPTVTANSWTLTTGNEAIRGFTRSIQIGDVSRDSNGVIVSSGGTLDPSTKKVDSTVSWGTPYLSSVSSTVYLTRFTNTTHIQNTQAVFNQGTNNGTVVTGTGGGQVILGAGGSSDWCSPNSSIVSTFDLPKNGEANAYSAYEGRLISGTGANASGVSLADVAISNTNPPIANLSGTFDGYKTNDVSLDGDYAFIATDTNNKEVIIVDLNTYQEIGYFNTAFNYDATSIFVSGNRGYVVAGSFLHVFDLSSKTGARPQMGQFVFVGNATSVVVSGNYGYVSLSASPIEMQIIDISDPQSMSNIGWADVNGTDGKKIFVNQANTRAYLATNADPSRKEFFIIDVSSKTGSRPTLGSYDSSGMNPTNLSIVPGNKALLVGSGAEEYQAIEIADETNPVRCGGMNVDSGINDVVGILESDGDAYSYLLTKDSTSELKIIAGGPGGQFSTSGTFTSKIFDASSSAAFNYFTPIFTQPGQTTIKFHVAVAAPVDNSCTNSVYSFVGPVGTAGPYFTGSGSIPLITSGSYINPGRCFKYKAFLDTSDSSQTPIFSGMTVNYSL